MDQFDRKILAELQREPGLSAAAVAERVGLSHTPCWRRIRKLEEDGTIAGRALLLNRKALGLSADVFAEIRLKNHDEETLTQFEHAVSERPEILECFSMSGERDYLMRIIVADIAAYETFLKKVLLHLPGVGSVNSSFALACVKSTTRLPV
ncbi:MAG: Lrp/AsnC family transcriptional regulator [Candidatus Sphingomonas colombiensis]|nr:Lrp/AsnC family transcriptional regulator [Sphingomonas sp.]WEK42896.1 MAG: Lrp/AsnC family transcriptional regulator [Sphingomonas sp.]